MVWKAKPCSLLYTYHGIRTAAAHTVSLFAGHSWSHFANTYGVHTYSVMCLVFERFVVRYNTAVKIWLIYKDLHRLKATLIYVLF
jgi:hypothetical protein